MPSQACMLGSGSEENNWRNQRSGTYGKPETEENTKKTETLNRCGGMERKLAKAAKAKWKWMKTSMDSQSEEEEILRHSWNHLTSSNVNTDSSRKGYPYAIVLEQPRQAPEVQIRPKQSRSSGPWDAVAAWSGKEYFQPEDLRKINGQK